MKLKDIVVEGYPVKSFHYEGSSLFPRRKLLRAFLIERVGVCYWCGKKVKDYPHIEGVPRLPDFATIDHLLSSKSRKKGDFVERVLACFECNNRRSYDQQRKKLP